MRVTQFFLFIFAAFFLFIPPLHAQTLEDQAIESLRFKAEDFLKAGDVPAALMTLETAREQARTIGDAYTRTNNLRYIGQLYSKAGDTTLSRESFDEAMGVAITITPWNRRLSGVIGVVELQGASGDVEGTRLNAMRAIDAGILELPAQNNVKGETGRFLTALDGVLYPMDFAEILVRLRKINQDRLRLAAFAGLEKIRMQHEAKPDMDKPDDYPSNIALTSQQGATLTSFISDNPNASADKLEKILWLCATARIHAIRDGSLVAQENIKNARTLLRSLPRDKQEKPEMVIEKTVELLAIAP